MGGECGLFNMLGKQCQGSNSGKSQDYNDLIRVMRGHDRTKKRGNDKDKFILRIHSKDDLRLVTFETYAQSDEKTSPDQQKDHEKDKHKHNDDDKYIYRTPSNGNPRAGEVGKLLTFLTIENLKA